MLLESWQCEVVHRLPFLRIAFDRNPIVPEPDVVSGQVRYSKQREARVLVRRVCISHERNRDCAGRLRRAVTGREQYDHKNYNNPRH